MVSYMDSYPYKCTDLTQVETTILQIWVSKFRTVM